MIFDFHNVGMVAGQVIAFPDWVFPDLPRQSPIIEQVFIGGSEQGTSISVGGTFDQQE